MIQGQRRIKRKRRRGNKSGKLGGILKIAESCVSKGVCGLQAFEKYWRKLIYESGTISAVSLGANKSMVVGLWSILRANLPGV